MRKHGYEKSTFRLARIEHTKLATPKPERPVQPAPLVCQGGDGGNRDCGQLDRAVVSPKDTSMSKSFWRATIQTTVAFFMEPSWRAIRILNLVAVAFIIPMVAVSGPNWVAMIDCAIIGALLMATFFYQPLDQERRL